MGPDPHWLGLRFRGASGDDLATRVHATLAGVGIILDPGRTSYIASIMFGEDWTTCTAATAVTGASAIPGAWTPVLTAPSRRTISTATTAPWSGTPPWWSATSAPAEGPAGMDTEGPV